MDAQDPADLEARREVRDLWDRVQELGRLVERRRQVLELTRTLPDHDPAVEMEELEQAERQQACAWVLYLDLNRKVFVSV